ncbi:MAG: hypothetical protein AAGF56_04230 [Pseudomonadota bacterium]
MFSEPYMAANAVEALAEREARWEAAEAEQMVRFTSHEGDMADFVRTDPILQAVSWDYGTCIDMVSLLPPPMDGWGLGSNAKSVRMVADDQRAEIFYKTFDPDLSSDHPDFFRSERSVVVRISDQPAMVEITKMRLENEMMREAAYNEGPYGYPIERFGNRAVLGKYTVDVSGTDDAMALAYFTQIIGCAIDNGLIADGLDPASLRDTP